MWEGLLVDRMNTNTNDYLRKSNAGKKLIIQLSVLSVGLLIGFLISHILTVDTNRSSNISVGVGMLFVGIYALIVKQVSFGSILLYRTIMPLSGRWAQIIGVISIIIGILFITDVINSSS